MLILLLMIRVIRVVSPALKRANFQHFFLFCRVALHFDDVMARRRACAFDCRGIRESFGRKT